MTRFDTDDELAARLRPTLTAYYDAPGPTDVVRLLDGHPRGAAGFLQDCCEAARRWVTSRPSGEEAATCLPPPDASEGHR